MTWAGASAHLDRRPFLLARAKILAALRAWFDAQGFLETDVGALVPSPGAEIHTAAYALEDGWLHTSPEFAMKQLLAKGEARIFRLGAVYRKGERSPLHAPEFTMLEWYRAGAPYEAVMQDCLDILQLAARAIGAKELAWRGRTADPFAKGQTITVSDAMRTCAETDLHEAASARAENFSDWFAQVLVEKIEPRLGLGAPTLLTEYPIAEAALAQPCAHDPRVAERFELYACGVELANGYGELTDAAEQRRRFTAAMDEKERRYGERWPVPERFLEALEHMPPASGCALGVDRLVMLVTGARKIEDVQW